MRRHDQPTFHVPKGTWPGIIFAVLTAWSSAMGQNAHADRSPGSNPHSDPIEIASRSVQVWSDGAAQWLLLTGDVALVQGDRELRAQGAVLRIEDVELPEEQIRVYQAEVYAEGDVREKIRQHGTSRARVLATFRTSKQVKLAPYDPSRMQKLNGPPGNAPILARSGFFRPPTRGREPAEGGNPSSSPGPAAVAAAKPTQTSGEQPQAPPMPVSTAGSSNARPVKTAAAPSRPAINEVDVVPTQLTRPGTGEAQKTTSGGGNPTRSEPRGQDDGVQLTQAPFGTRSEPRTQLGADLPPIEGAPEVPNLNNVEDLPPALSPLPEEDDRRMLEPEAEMDSGGEDSETELPPLPGEGSRPSRAPMLPGTQRITQIKPRMPGSIVALDPTDEGVQVIIVRGGINIVTTTPQHGIVDLEADNAVIWRHLPDKDDKRANRRALDTGGRISEDATQPFEVYLEGHVVVRRDAQKFAGQGDQQTIQASRIYYDFVTDRSVNMDAEIDLFAPGFIIPFKVKAKQIDQFRPMVPLADGRTAFGQPEIRAEQSTMTGSRFPNPAYLITNKSIDVTRRVTGFVDPKTGKEIDDPNDPAGVPDLTWNFDARQNTFWMGWLPVFYWPRISGDIEDIEPPLRQLAFRSNTSASRCSPISTASGSLARSVPSGSTSGMSMSTT